MPDKCVWEKQDYDCLYISGCGEEWWVENENDFIYGSIGYNYCPHCGKQIEEIEEK